MKMATPKTQIPRFRSGLRSVSSSNETSQETTDIHKEYPNTTEGDHIKSQIITGDDRGSIPSGFDKNELSQSKESCEPRKAGELMTYSGNSINLECSTENKTDMNIEGEHSAYHDNLLDMKRNFDIEFFDTELIELISSVGKALAAVTELLIKLTKTKGSEKESPEIKLQQIAENFFSGWWHKEFDPHVHQFILASLRILEKRLLMAEKVLSEIALIARHINDLKQKRPPKINSAFDWKEHDQLKETDEAIMTIFDNLAASFENFQNIVDHQSLNLELTNSNKPLKEKFHRYANDFQKIIFKLDKAFAQFNWQVNTIKQENKFFQQKILQRKAKRNVNYFFSVIIVLLASLWVLHYLNLNEYFSWNNESIGICISCFLIFIGLLIFSLVYRRSYDESLLSCSKLD